MRRNSNLRYRIQREADVCDWPFATSGDVRFAVALEGKADVTVTIAKRRE
jgi:hypothetical protein